MRIEICGGIASGKTTLAQNLKNHGMAAALENFQANPFWKIFYEDPEKHAFETEITFLLQHYNQIGVANVRGHLACDFSLLLDLSYADINLSNGAYEAFAAVYNEVKRRLSVPELIVHLICGAHEELLRIRNRSRTEEAGIQLEYLANLNAAVASRVDESRHEVRVLEIDSEHRNFAEDRGTREAVIAEIEKAIY